MTLDAIKREISVRLREVRADSSEFSECAAYGDLQRLITKVISKVALCESADSLEAINDALAAIEDCWNDCKAEALGKPCDDVLFEFSFELEEVKAKPSSGDDDDSSQYDADETAEEEDGEEPEEEAQDEPQKENSEEQSDEESDEEPEEEEEEECETEEKLPVNKPDISKNVREIEEFFDKYENEGNFLKQARLKSLCSTAMSTVNAAQDRGALSVATVSYRRRFKQFAASIKRYNSYSAAKPDFDNSHPADCLKLPNIFRAVVGGIAFLTGIGYGIAKAIIDSLPVFAWDFWVWGLAGAGASYLLISLIYAVCAAKSYSVSVVRRLCFIRLIFALIAAVGSLVLGLTVEAVGLAGAYIATLPLTVGGIAVYLFYRLRLTALVSKKKRRKK